MLFKLHKFIYCLSVSWMLEVEIILTSYLKRYCFNNIEIIDAGLLSKIPRSRSVVLEKDDF